MTWRTRMFACALFAVCTSTANAQTYPNRPLRVIVSIAAGSVTDVIMRAAAREIKTKLGQPLVIENRGGASGILGGRLSHRLRETAIRSVLSITRPCRTTQ